MIECELRLAMKRENIAELPLYPEQRDCACPTTEQILRLYSLAERHQLMQDCKAIEVFDTQFTELQRQVRCLARFKGRLSHATTGRNSRQIASSKCGK